MNIWVVFHKNEFLGTCHSVGEAFDAAMNLEMAYGSSDVEVVKMEVIATEDEEEVSSSRPIEAGDTVTPILIESKRNYRLLSEGCNYTVSGVHEGLITGGTGSITLEEVPGVSFSMRNFRRAG
jgi:hypothetical protein